MRKFTTNQTGFGIIGIAVIAVVVLALGGSGYAVYKAHNKPKTPTSASTTTSSTTPAKTDSTTTPPTAATVTTQGTYLDLSQVGVKFLLSSSVSDAVYAPFSSPSTDGSQAFGISTQALINARGSSLCGAAQGTLGIVVVTTTAPKQFGTAAPATPDNKTLFKIGNDYYQYTPPQADGCFGGAVTDTQVQADINAVGQSFASLQSDTATAN